MEPQQVARELLDHLDAAGQAACSKALEIGLAQAPAPHRERLRPIIESAYMTGWAEATAYLLAKNHLPEIVATLFLGMPPHERSRVNGD